MAGPAVHEEEDHALGPRGEVGRRGGGASGERGGILALGSWTDRSAALPGLFQQVGQRERAKAAAGADRKSRREPLGEPWGTLAIELSLAIVGWSMQPRRNSAVVTQHSPAPRPTSTSPAYALI